MPLDKTCSQDAFDANVSRLVKEGKGQNQALAIAFSTLKKACGVVSDKRMTTKEIIAKGANESCELAARLRDVIDRRPMTEGNNPPKEKSSWSSKVKQAAMEMKMQRNTLVDAASAKNAQVALKAVSELLISVVDAVEAMYGSKARNVTKHLEMASDILLGYTNAEQNVG